jgi:methylase of polypeptide subunit release factors
MGGRLILRDLPRAITGADPKPDHVLPVGGASVLVSQLTPRGRVGVAADIGTGQGYQAFGLAEHADRVIATDVNPRALRLAGLARDLAGGASGNLSLVEFREGSLFEPLKAEAGALDVIVSNPPFVIAPPQDVVGYSDRAVSGDGLVAALVTEACGMLAPGGWCVLVGNWAYRGEEARDGRWAATPTRWIEAGNARAGGGAGVCDALILHMGSYAARSYAFKWMEETGTPRERLTPSRMDAWMRYYAELGIDAVAFGAIVLRRRRGGGAVAGLPPVIRAESVDTPAKHAPCAGTIERTLAGAVWLAQADAMGAQGPVDRLGSWTPRLTPDAVLVREATPDHAGGAGGAGSASGGGSGRGSGRGSGAWRTTEIYAVQRGGIPRRVGLDSVAADVLAQLDGTRSVDDAGRRVARSHGLDCSGQEAAARARELVRGLAALGYFEADWLDR